LAWSGNSVARDRSREAGKSSARDDVLLIARVRDRDLRAFETLYRKYHPRLARFLMNLVRRPQLVEEVLNDTLMVVWERPDSFRGASSLSTWVFAIAYRKAMKALRRRDEPIEDADAENRASPDADPEQQANDRRVQDALISVMNELSPDHRAVVDLTYFHEMGYREIADIMECPVDTVKTRIFHARRQLKRKLAGELADWL
jgi:RNA polymerase sigma-70 factor (ECF subfamily)